ncbi:hypothetical protein GGS21DRAFT_468065 [Xylaria nigripes]|nr:hypothetical protein GGS21DRAFT_468065 [Xylaria nigripes]
MSNVSKFATAPAPWAAVLLGHGSFLQSTDQVHLSDGELNYIIPDTASFLQMRPSIHCRQRWPFAKSSTGKAIDKYESMVFLVVCTGHACYDNRIVTEFGFTMFDTRDRWIGGKCGTSSRAKAEGCMPLGDRGMNMVRLYDSHHYIIADTADHHNGSCSNARHQEKPFEFCYRRSKIILRRDLNKTLEMAFSMAEKKGLEIADLKRGVRRPVTLLTWGRDVPDVICDTTWFRNVAFAEHWDISQHQLLKKSFPKGITFADALRVFGVPHMVGTFDIAQNSGNRSSFTMQLLWAIALATGEQMDTIKGADKDGNHRQVKPWGSPGVQSVLTRDNLPPGSEPPGAEWIEYTQPPRPQTDSYKRVGFDELCRASSVPKEISQLRSFPKMVLKPPEKIATSLTESRTSPSTTPREPQRKPRRQGRQKQ